MGKSLPPINVEPDVWGAGGSMFLSKGPGPCTGSLSGSMLIGGRVNVLHNVCSRILCVVTACDRKHSLEVQQRNPRLFQRSNAILIAITLELAMKIATKQRTSAEHVGFPCSEPDLHLHQVGCLRNEDMIE